MKILLLTLCCCGWFTAALTAQSEAYITIAGIDVIGQKRTREAVIFRELPIKIGDTIALNGLVEKIREAERQLLNTNLFSKVLITYKDWQGSTQRVRLQVEVLENWYLYPVPTFDLADRNFNVWWQEQGRSLDRVNIGLEISHHNFTGWGDKAEIEFEYGYTRQYGMSYRLPYVNRAKTLGLSTSFSYSRNREVNYATENNKQLFYRDETRFLRQNYKLNGSLQWRPDIYGAHTFALEYVQEEVDPIIIQEYNPDYFGNGKTRIDFLRFLYAFTYDFRDNRAYPWSGYLYGTELLKDGLGVFSDRSALTVDVFGAKFWPVGERWSVGVNAGAKYSLIRRPQPYRYNRALGFGRGRVTGFELYLLDGLDAVYWRNSARFRIWENQVTFGKWVFIEAFRELPFHLNLSLAGDLGYVNSPFNTRPNPLNNRLLRGAGVGLDLVFYYDFVLRVQYNVNSIGDRGFFLDFDIGI